MSNHTFPAIKPSRVTELTPPEYKNSTTQFDDKNEQTIITQLIDVDYKLGFQYDLLDEFEVATLIRFNRSVYGTADSFFLPLTLLDYPPAIITAMTEGGYVSKWKLVEPISWTNIVASVQRGKFQTAVKFRSVVE